MRVLQLIGSTGMYGAEAVVGSLARGLPRVGIETCIGHVRYARPDALKLEEHLLGCDVIPFPQSNRLDMTVLSQLRKEIKSRNIEAIHSHGYKPDFYGRIVASVAGIPVISTCHLWTKSTRALRAYAHLDAVMLRRFDRVVAVSEPILKELKDAKVPDEKLSYIPNGIYVTDFLSALPAYRYLFPRNSFVFGAAGRQVDAKGIHILLQAMNRIAGLMPQARLLIAGNGPKLANYREMAWELGIGEKVEFLGRCEAMPDFYASLDAFLLPSLDEGLPIALLEAMASARTIIATDVGSVKSAVRNEATGLLIAAGSVEALSSAMLSVISNQERLTRLGAAARVEILTNFSSQKMVNRYAQLYREVSSR
jgi:glycosyltransferase involved in cell wall biosynthesis